MAASSRTSSHLNMPLPEKDDHTSAVPSTTASVFDEKEREEHIPQDVEATSDKDQGADLTRVESGDYPTKMKLWIILIAVMLAIFLVALDMVSSPRSPQNSYHGGGTRLSRRHNWVRPGQQ